MKSFLRSFLLVVLGVVNYSCSAPKETFDVVVVGGGASGVCAGVQSARMGSRTLIVEETDWLGGMLTAAGVSAIDGNNRLPAGLWGEFRAKLASHYGGIDSLKTGWVSNTLFEPSVGNSIFHSMTAAEDSLSVWKNTIVKSAKRKNGSWKVRIQTAKDNRSEAKETVRTVETKVLIDATELGDIAKMCGVKYDIGMESRQDTHEDIAPEAANGIIQDLTYVAVLKDYGRDVSISQPEGYSSDEFACCCYNSLCVSPKEPKRLSTKEMMITYGRLPNNKYMINWPIEGNDYYLNIIELGREEREKALLKAKQRTMRFLYFLQHELGYTNLGLADDEFPTADRLPFIPYHRESRRIHGLVRFTANHMAEPYSQDEPLYRTNIAVGDYPVDHHHARYEGWEELPDLHFHPVPSFGLPLGTLLPQSVDGLIVAEKSVSVSNIANGATRLQPVVMQIGQAAGALAALSASRDVDAKEVSVRDVQNALLNAGGYLMPYLDVPQEDKRFKPYQRIGATGILRGVGRSVNWSNESWFRADTVLLVSELDGLFEYYPYAKGWLPTGQNTLSRADALTLLQRIAAQEDAQNGTNAFPKSLFEDAKEALWGDDIGSLAMRKSLYRGEFAMLLDSTLDPFNRKTVDIHGNITTK